MVSKLIILTTKTYEFNIYADNRGIRTDIRVHGNERHPWLPPLLQTNYLKFPPENCLY